MYIKHYLVKSQKMISYLQINTYIHIHIYIYREREREDYCNAQVPTCTAHQKGLSILFKVTLNTPSITLNQSILFIFLKYTQELINFAYLFA